MARKTFYSRYGKLKLKGRKNGKNIYETAEGKEYMDK